MKLISTIFAVIVFCKAEPPCDNVKGTPTNFYLVCEDSCTLAICDASKIVQQKGACPDQTPNCVEDVDKKGSCVKKVPTGGTACGAGKPDPPCDGVIPLPAEDFTACTDACKIALCDPTGKKVTENACPNSALNCVAAADKTGACSATSKTSESSCSVFLAPKFTCTASLGKFPDPYDCRGYYVCPKDIVTTPVPAAIRRMCAATEVFSEATGLCVASSDSTKCITVDCSVKMGNGIYSPYGTSTKYYALCTGAAPNWTIKMYQCATGAAFDKTVGISKCVYKCTAAGKFAYSLDNKKYYNCVKGTGTTITPTLSACPTGTVFSTTDKDCGFAASLDNSTTV